MSDASADSFADRRQWFDIHIQYLPAWVRARYTCPCCGYPTLTERNRWDICPNCWWEDDGQDDPHADEVWGGPNSNLSLTQARQNYVAFGASSRERLVYVRPLRPEEL